MNSQSNQKYTYNNKQGGFQQSVIPFAMRPPNGQQASFVSNIQRFPQSLPPMPNVPVGPMLNGMKRSKPKLPQGAQQVVQIQ